MGTITLTEKDLLRDAKNKKPEDLRHTDFKITPLQYNIASRVEYRQGGQVIVFKDRIKTYHGKQTRV
jgi:hypothetical protein